jgi:hypothetical protein
MPGVQERYCTGCPALRLLHFGSRLTVEAEDKNVERSLMMSIHSKSAAHTWLPSLRRVFFTIALAALLLGAGLSPQGLSQSTASPAPDILILTNGDQLTGKFTAIWQAT